MTIFKKLQSLKPHQKLEFSILSLILLLASFLRLYRIADYMTFLGDEGRDVLVAKAILEGDLTLLGPRASAGDFFLGPIYYYMIAPFLWVTKLDPVGPAIMVALIGIATVWLVYFVGKRLFGIKAAFFAAALYAVSPLVIAYSRSSWNPNPMPFFSLLTLYLLYEAVRENKWRLFVVVGILLGIAMQLHYLSTFLAVIIACFVLVGTIIVDRTHILKRYVLNFLQIGVGFVVGFLPFIAFEVRHGFPNTRTILSFIFRDNFNEEYVTNISYSTIVQDVFFRLFGRLITKFPPPEQVAISESQTLIIWQFLTIILGIVSVLALFIVRSKLKIALFSIWLILGIGLFGMYKKPIYDYYFGFMFPLPFLLVGNLLEHLTKIPKIKIIGIVAAAGIFGFLFLFNLYANPFRFEPNRQKLQAETISQFILDKTRGESFNFALITPGNSDHVYRYYFEIKGNSPVTIENHEIDPERRSVTDQLFVICEGGPCQPLGHPLWEVAGFGRAEVAGHWRVSVVEVYKLVPYAE